MTVPARWRLAATTVVSAALVIVIAAAGAGAPAEPQAQPTNSPPAVVEEPTPQPTVLAETTPPPTTVTITPNSGEGLISLTRRACGTDATWQAQAAALGLTPPAYAIDRVPYTLDCGAVPAAAPLAPPAPAVAEWAHPTGAGCITPNGSREYGTDRGDHRHGGIDLGPVTGVNTGDPIYAVHAGTAHHGYQAGGAGTYVWVDHEDDTSSWYFHMSSRAVADGAHVEAGQTIGYVGSSGNASSPHLHFETKVNGSRTDPVPFMADRGIDLSC